jgi:hypothetical protein
VRRWGKDHRSRSRGTFIEKEWPKLTGERIVDYTEVDCLRRGTVLNELLEVTVTARPHRLESQFVTRSSSQIWPDVGLGSYRYGGLSIPWCVRPGDEAILSTETAKMSE